MDHPKIDQKYVVYLTLYGSGYLDKPEEEGGREYGNTSYSKLKPLFQKKILEKVDQLAELIFPGFNSIFVDNVNNIFILILTIDEPAYNAYFRGVSPVDAIVSQATLSKYDTWWGSEDHTDMIDSEIMVDAELNVVLIGDQMVFSNNTPGIFADGYDDFFTYDRASSRLTVTGEGDITITAGSALDNSLRKGFLDFRREPLYEIDVEFPDGTMYKLTSPDGSPLTPMHLLSTYTQYQTDSPSSRVRMSILDGHFKFY